MKIQLDCKALKNALSLATKVVGKKAITDYAQAVKINVVNNQSAALTTCSEELMMSLPMPIINADEQGVFYTDAYQLLDAISTLPDTLVSFDVEVGKKVKVDYPNGHFVLPLKDCGDAFPKMTETNANEKSFTLSAKMERDCVEECAHGLGNDQIRPVMEGVFHNFTPDCLDLVGTDGKTLVRNRISVVKSQEPCSFILHRKAAAILVSLLRNATDTDVLGVAFDTQNVVFTMDGGFTFAVRLIDGRYPNYNGVIDPVYAGCKHTARCDGATLRNVARNVGVFASSTSDCISLTFDAFLQEVAIEGKDIDFARSRRDTMALQSYEGENGLKLGFSAKKIVDMLPSDCGAIDIKMVSPDKAAIIEPVEQGEQVSTTYLIMPMMLNKE